MPVRDGKGLAAMHLCRGRISAAPRNADTAFPPPPPPVAGRRRPGHAGPIESRLAVSESPDVLAVPDPARPERACPDQIRLERTPEQACPEPARPEPPGPARSREHPHPARGRGRVPQPRDDVFGRKGQFGAVAPARQGLRAGPAADSVAARGYRLEVPGNDRLPRSPRRRTSTPTPRASRRASVRSATARRCTPT